MNAFIEDDSFEQEAIDEGRVVAFHVDGMGIEYALWKGYGLCPQVHFFEEDIKNNTRRLSKLQACIARVKV